MRIGQLATQAGVPASRIRFYEAQCLLPLPARRASGYRDYNEEALAIVSFIARARSLGFTLKEIAAHLRSPDNAERKARLLALAQAKLAELDARVDLAIKQRDALGDAVFELCELLGRRSSLARTTDGGGTSTARSYDSGVRR